MLIGRESETARIDHLLEEARSGRSSTLVLSGEPGIGKSALCAYARERAAGLTVLFARGTEAEQELPFAALADLLQPVLALFAEIPEPQAAALRAGLALGPPAAGDRFTTCAATLSLLAAAAERTPVLAVVDDAHWLDLSSTEALLFAARRLDAEGVAILLALRDPVGTPFATAELPQLELGGLNDSSAAVVLARASEETLAAEVAEHLIRASRGNPLALLELPALLTPPQREGREPIANPLPTSEELRRSFLHRVRELDEETQRALLVAAASGSANFDEVIAAVMRAGLSAEALDPAERAGLTIVEGPQFDFRHPLLRAAVYDDAPAAARRAAHEAAAAASAEQLRAWHLAAAASDHDATVAAELERAAASSQGRGGHAEAAAALERAAELATGPDEQARLLRDAADQARQAGQNTHALELLERAQALATEPELVSRIQHLRGVIEMWSGSAAVAHQLLSAAADRAEPTDRGRATWLLTDAGWACFMAGEIGRGRSAAERACALADGGIAEILSTALLGIALLLTGERRRAEPLLHRHWPLLDKVGFLDRTYNLIWPAALALMWMEEHDQAREVFTRVIELARARSVPSLLPYALTGLADLDFRTGMSAQAYANASESVELAAATQQPSAKAFALATLARIEAAQGREDDCRAHAVEALDIAEGGVGAVVPFATAALGLLELGLGRSQDAIPHLERSTTGARERGLAEPNVLRAAPDFVEALTRSGRTEDAAAALAAFEIDAAASGSAWAAAAVARCRGMLASDGEYRRDFADSIELERTCPSPFERARTELALGERLRRGKRRKDARPPLRSALEQFERLGFRPWAERARNELLASGETLRRPDLHAASELTAQELRVALLVARGATNREAGTALFLSPKTIEAHLGRVYRKLNVRSRTELAALLARDSALQTAG